MINRKLHFPILVYILLVLLSLQSCEKEKPIPLKAKKNTVYYHYTDLADKHYENKRKDSAFFYFNKAKSACKIGEENSKIIYAMLKMAYIQREEGDHFGTETTATEIIPFFQKDTDIRYKGCVYDLLGLCSERLLDYDSALMYYKMEYDIDTTDVEKISVSNNMALVYMNKKDYPSAIALLLPKVKMQKNLELHKRDAVVLDNLGYSYFKMGNPEGLEYLLQSLAIQKEADNDLGMTTSYFHLSEYYKENNPKLSKEYALLAYEKAIKSKNAHDQIETLAALIKDSNGNDTKKYSEKYIQLSDSVTKARQIAKNQFAKVRYDSKKEKDENLLLKTDKIETALQLEKQKNTSLYLIFLTIIGAIFSFSIYYFLKERHRSEKIKNTYETETRISKKLHDELANDVFQTLAFAETQDLSSNESKDFLVNHLDAIYSRTRNISRENSSIETGRQFVPNLKEMLSGFNSKEVNILINGLDTVDWAPLDSNKQIIVYRVLQELLVNMKKHSNCSLVVLTFKNIKNIIHINYSDNGVGATIDKLNLKNGLRNVENRIQAINGKITFESESDKGFKVHCLIPV